MKDIKDIIIKAEKLTSAVYLITSFISDLEPIKWQLRQAALNFLSDIVQRGAGLPSEKLMADLEQVLLLIKVVLSGNSFSNMNFSIVCREYELIKEAVDQELKQELVLPGAPLPTAPHSPLIDSIGEFHRPSALRGDSLSAAGVANQRKTARNKVNNHSQIVGGGAGGRRELILKFIKTNGWSSIKEITGFVPGVSSKTVQRELVALVNNGVLKREGERRWSRYGFDSH